MATSNDEGNLDAVYRDFGTFNRGRRAQKEPAPAPKPVRRDPGPRISAAEAKRRFDSAGDMSQYQKRWAAADAAAARTAKPKAPPPVRRVAPASNALARSRGPAAPIRTAVNRVRFGSR